MDRTIVLLSRPLYHARWAELVFTTKGNLHFCGQHHLTLETKLVNHLVGRTGCRARREGREISCRPGMSLGSVINFLSLSSCYYT